jgi:hypothetical protein
MNCLYSGHVALFCRAKTSTNQSTPLRCGTSPPEPVFVAVAPTCTDDATPTGVPFQQALVEETELLRSELRDYIAHVGSVLARAEDSLRKLQVASVVPLFSEL